MLSKYKLSFFKTQQKNNARYFKDYISISFNKIWKQALFFLLTSFKKLAILLSPTGKPHFCAKRAQRKKDGLI
jgi:hypothetical protein